ncbi:MFS_1_like domain-containing protein [Trichonephila clavata]|uniref:MFS_1_like domain-containing protein n=1 Tax=Trichonephila clavata TaxID=2740835 RepID=A0A8X6FY89_TRICU|nr:MFS_1_like domain-containing protein [Trichonephila clavata]
MEKKEKTGHDNSTFVAEIALSDLTQTEDTKNMKVADVADSKPPDSNNFTIKLWKDHTISICKPLIPLKLALFTYYGAGSFMPSFMTVLYKQRGVSLSELASMTIIAPIIQFLGSATSGVVADKIGRAKPVLFVNLFLLLLLIIGILFLPKIDRTNCLPYSINLTCSEEQQMAQTECNLLEKKIEISLCEANCSKNVFEKCDDRTSACKIFDEKELKNLSLSVYIDNFHDTKIDNQCSYYVTALEYENNNISWCDSNRGQFCSLSCTVDPKINHCKPANPGSLLIIYTVLYVLFLTTYSNCYRCMDVTTMFMVKEYGSNFGHERFFAISGNLLISPLAGYIAQVSTPVGGEKNYGAALYLFIAMICFLFFVLYNLPVRVTSPSENMWRKSLALLKNIDVVLFFIIILTLGTSWNFTKYFLFWYLEEMNAPSLLLGLITSVSALYGLPFLLTAKWWVQKIGANGIIILAFIAYAIYSTGYSFLENPWYALILEANGILTYYLLWVAVVEHSHDIAPEGLTSTIITISGAIHYSIGKATSGLSAGFIMSAFGGKVAFRFNALLCLCCAFFYGSYVFIRKRCLGKKHKLDHADTSTGNGKLSNMLTMPDKK